MYHLHALTQEKSLTLGIEINRIPNKSTAISTDLPTVPSISHVYESANWHEREAYDLMGIHFEGHPDLRRILLPTDWEGYPLRKDYEPAPRYHNLKTT